MDSRSCKHCEELFQPRPQNPKQGYCSKPECQKARKRLWQKEKLKSDPDYRENQHQAQKRWQENNPDYWNRWRERNASYVEHNRQCQRERNAKRRNMPVVVEGENDTSMFAKMDALKENIHLLSGTYKLVPVDADCKDGRVNNGFICEISHLSDLGGDCKERTLSP